MAPTAHLHLDLPFCTVPTRGGERTLTLDLWLPAQRNAPCPTIVYIHGGGWRTGSPYRPPFQPRFFDRGVAVAAITYRWSGEAAFPAQLADCRAALRWLRTHAAAYRLDAARFGVWGISAGGHLALLLAAAEGREGVRAACAFCSPTDFWHTATAPDPGDGMVQMVSELLGVGDLRGQRTMVEGAGVVGRVSADFPPTLLVHGLADNVVPPHHSQLLAERLTSANVPTRLLLLPDVDHNIFGVEPALAVDRFFIDHLCPAVTPVTRAEMVRLFA